MGIIVEFNPNLALRPYGTLGRLEEECIPEVLEVGGRYHFLKNGQRNYWLEGEIPLVSTKGNQELSRPLASITILEATHFTLEGQIHTRGIYKVNEFYDMNDQTIHFEGMEKLK